jgi:glutamine synthetase
MAMSDDGLVMLAWSDYVGVTRCRGVLTSQFDERLETGLGWAVAGQALTPFADIAPNPWGPMLEVRQVPDPSSRVTVDIWPDAPPLDFVMCDSRTPDGESWDCCTRGFLRKALDDLRAEAGVELLAAFEHEFTVVPQTDVAPPFSLAAMREQAQLTHDIARALAAAGLTPETVEPEYGYSQYEVTVSPSRGLSAGDQAIATREIIRECARRLGLQATFSPKPFLDGPGNGAHVHFSFVAADGTNATYDPSHETGASALARSFIAGVVRHMPAMCALVAPSPVSYYRLGPHHWSCGYASFGIQNREAAIRICPSTSSDPQAQARGFNLELRPPDPTASPYVVLGALVRAGLEGVRAGLELPPACVTDPAELSDDERVSMGIVPLPSTLSEAIDMYLADEKAFAWLPDTMRDSYLDVKRMEVSLAEVETDDETAARYRKAY